MSFSKSSQRRQSLPSFLKRCWASFSLSASRTAPPPTTTSTATSSGGPWWKKLETQLKAKEEMAAISQSSMSSLFQTGAKLGSTLCHNHKICVGRRHSLPLCSFIWTINFFSVINNKFSAHALQHQDLCVFVSLFFFVFAFVSLSFCVISKFSARAQQHQASTERATRPQSALPRAGHRGIYKVFIKYL